MASRKILVCMAMAALVAALALVGCGGSQAASSSAAASDTASSAAASAAADSASASAAASAEAAASSAAAAPAASAASATSNYIGEQAAKDIALNHAGLSAGDCIELEAELDLDSAVVHYDVDFKSGGMEYDYDIDAVTGDIINSHSEVDD